jgi:hypothetical protein
MNNKRNFFGWALSIVCATFLIGSCGGDDSSGPPPPEPGQLTVSVSSSATGAAFNLRITGEDIANPVQAVGSHEIYTFASGDTLNTAVIGQVSSGDLLRFSVPDVNQAASYRVTLVEVAGTDNALLSNSSFTVSISQ